MIKKWKNPRRVSSEFDYTRDINEQIEEKYPFVVKIDPEYTECAEAWISGRHRDAPRRPFTSIDSLYSTFKQPDGVFRFMDESDAKRFEKVFRNNLTNDD